ncbi:Arc family DNA-binding protein [Bacteroidota bacterium]
MGKKKPFVLRIEPEMLNELQKWADDEFRSTNGHIEWILDQALNKAGRKKKP